MNYFSTEFLRYFEMLEKNNTTIWFDQNRKWYEREVKEPFYRFTDELIIQLKSLDASINIMPEEAIYRINNDIRYSREKIPYKTWMTANISAYGKKGKDYPGFYLLMNHQHLILAGGSYQSEKHTLQQIRMAIKQDPEAFRSAFQSEAFQQTFGGLKGEYNKLLPMEFRQTAEILPEIALKQFYFRKELPASTILSSDLPMLIKKEFEQALALHRFLCKALRQFQKIAA